MTTDLCTTDEILSLRTQIIMTRRADESTVARVAALLERFPESADLWVLHGKALLLAGMASDAARESFERALVLAPGHADAADALRALPSDASPRQV